MPRPPGTTDAQNTFLRAFITHPAGPAPEDWPSPAVLRRWLRKPGFQLALRSIRDTQRHQSDLHLASASNHAAQLLASLAADLAYARDADQIANCKSKIANATTLLRTAHLRQRFAPVEPPISLRRSGSPDPDKPGEDRDVMAEAIFMLKFSQPDHLVRDALEFWENRHAALLEDQQREAAAAKERHKHPFHRA